MDNRPLLNDDSLNEQQALGTVPQMKSQTHVFISFPNSAIDQDDDDDNENNVSNNNRNARMYNITNSDQFPLSRPVTSSSVDQKQQPRLWQFDYYQQYFQVDTKQVLQRLLDSITPRSNFDANIRQNPDLYGPFWICVTFIFTIAISGNITNYFHLSSAEFQIDFSKITLSSTILFLYWWLMPTFMYLFFRWRLNRIEYTYLELLCVYGYSLTIFIPISILWMIQINWLQWLLTIFGSLISSSVLIITFWPVISIDQKRLTLLSIVVVFLMHTCLAVTIMLVFFHVSDSNIKPNISTTTKETTMTKGLITPKL
ncbi:unnamed protein product [Didymodactylos carnosus]|uniref:Protein YIPF n=1 Tax=Didymodactylos carnosus TaxID=1234261 RepID=A0A814PJF8_9BILA|nr:unnamed protein product [Didymodactylos carnosus]CAF1105828.1 unnamed protein product [Didymodactylos carnosus]CAF1273921.1 unnamed protein product [Didymodactylos carnosus]CAF3870482.1 unnamed protein product [Didymodactylos carnosus]CAF3870501.1 unnamed protein product [Didymodactylos carnosus]